MKRRTWLVVAIGLLLAAGLGFAVLDPNARLQGWVGGEPFFQGRSATAWRRDLSQPDEVESAAAREALINGKSDALTVCVWILERAPESVARARAADALKQMGPEGRPAGAALLNALDDPDPIVRAVAFQTVEALAPDLPADAMPQLIAHCPAIEAIRAIARYGPDAKDAIPKLVELLRNDDWAVRFQAVRALARIGEPAIPQVPAFIRMMATDDKDKVREIAAEAIGQLGPPAAAAHPEAVPALAKALHDPAAVVRRDAVRSLGQLGPIAKPVLDEVKVLEKDENERVRKAATQAAKQIGR